MTNPVVDLVGDKTGRIVPVYPQSEKAGVMTLGRRQVGGRGAAPGRRVRRARADVACSTGYDLVDRTHRVPRHPRARVDGRGRGGPPAAGVRRAAAGAARARAAQAGARGDQPGHRATTSSGELVRRFHERPAVPAHRRRRRGSSPRSSADLAGPHPDAPPAAGRRRRGQDGRRRERPARRRAGRAPGRAHGAHRGARRAALASACAPLLEGFTVPDDERDSLFGGAG